MGGTHSELIYGNGISLLEKYKNSQITYQNCIYIIGMKFLEVATTYDELLRKLKNMQDYYLITFRKYYLLRKNHISIYASLTDKKLRYFLRKYGKIYKSEYTDIFSLNIHKLKDRKIFIYNQGNLCVFDSRKDVVAKLSRCNFYCVFLI